MLADGGLAHFSRWLDAVVARPSCVETCPPAAELVEGYVKLLERMKAMKAAA